MTHRDGWLLISCDGGDDEVTRLGRFGAALPEDHSMTLLPGYRRGGREKESKG